MPVRTILSSLVLLSSMPLMAGSAISPASDLHVVISPMAGYYKFDDCRYLKNKFYPNISIGVDFTDRIGAELYWGYLGNPRRTDGQTLHHVSKMHIADAVGLFRFNTNSKVRPYVLAGVGITHINPNGVISVNNPSGDEDHEQFHITGGAGVLFQVSDTLALRADVRDALTTASHANDIMFNFGFRWGLV